MNDKPEIEQLLRSVERQYGKVLSTTTDFEVFSLHLKRTNGKELSASTLKRLWGYVSDDHQPRTSTLDILSQYAGHDTFRDFIAWLKENTTDNSEYLDMHQIISPRLSPGDRIRIGWSPDRLLLLTYLGNNSFEVLEAENSKIHVGDQFAVGCFIQGQPLIIPYIIRNGQHTPPFLAGREGGLTVLKRLT